MVSSIPEKLFHGSGEVEDVVEKHGGEDTAGRAGWKLIRDF